MVKTNGKAVSVNRQKQKYTSPQVFYREFGTNDDIICSSGWDSSTNDRYLDDLDWPFNDTVQTGA